MEKNKFIVNFLLKEVILKYLFCYILSVITLSVPLIFKINDPWNSWLISFSASIFSLPVIFVIYRRGDEGSYWAAFVSTLFEL